MTDKTMPERIAILRSDEDECFCVAPLMTLGNQKVCEYVRADLVPAQGSADEPLVDGQYRWLKIYGSWFACYIASLTRGDGNFYFLMPGYDSGFPRDDKMVEEVGPAIHPPRA